MKAPPSGRLLKPDEYKHLVLSHTGTELTRPRDVRYSRDGEHIVIAGDGGAEIREAKTLRLLAILDMNHLKEEGAISDAFAADFSPDGRYVAFDWQVHEQGKMRSKWCVVIADWRAKKLVRTIPCESKIHCLRYSPDGKWIAAGCSAGWHGKNDIRVWNAETGELEFEDRVVDDGATGQVVFSPDSKYMAAVTKFEISLWECGVWKRSWWSEQGEKVVFRRAGELAVLVDMEKVDEEDPPRSNGIVVLECPGLKVKSRIGRFLAAGGGSDASVNPGGNWFACGGTARLTIDHIETGKWYGFDLETGPMGLSGVDFSPDGKRIVFLISGTCVLLNTEWLGK